MSEHNTHSVEVDPVVASANSAADAKAVVALIVLVVITTAFWLIGQ